MLSPQKQTVEDILAKWAGFGFSPPKVYAAEDSDDVLLVATKDDEAPLAARVNSVGDAKLGQATTPALGEPLRPLASDHPNYGIG